MPTDSPRSSTPASLPVIAVDFGASSIRVCVVDLDQRPVRTTVVHRYEHQPTRRSDGSLRWEWATLVAEAKRGIDLALAMGPAASIGIDTWGLDYGLLDAGGRLVADPFSYRDSRLTSWESTADRLGRRRLYDVTGTQLMAGNSVFQLAAHDRSELDRTAHVMMLPELLIHELCGVVTAEVTSAGTTALVDRSTGTWSDDIVDDIGADRSWFADIMPAGVRVGTWRNTPVHLIGGHDTACAVLAMAPAPSPGAVFVSGGTLFLIGREHPTAVINDSTFTRNISNEPGAFGGVRLLVNQQGTWLLDQCRRHWGAPSVAALLADVSPEHNAGVLFDTGDPSLVAPSNMPAAIAALTGLPADTPPPVVCASIVRSMATAVAAAVNNLTTISGTDVSPTGTGPTGTGPTSAGLPDADRADADRADQVVFFGGASGSDVLAESIAMATGLPVLRGSQEATAVGNALAQGIALGQFTDVAHARSALAPR